MFLNIEGKAPQSCAVKDGAGGVLTYGDLAEFALELKRVIPPRSLVFCLCNNDCGSLAGYYGLYEAQCVSLLLDSALDQQLLGNLTATYGPEYLWCAEGHNDSPSLFSFRGYKLVRVSRQSPPMHAGLSFLLTTSGSTGSPKLVRHKYGNLEHNAKAVAEVFGWTAEERGLCQLPMHYTMGLNVINSHLYAGSTVLLCSHGLMSKDFWDFLKGEQATSFTGVPYSYEILLKMKMTKMDLPHLKTLASGGGKLTDEVFVKLAEYAEATGRRFFSTFGTTETSARLAFLPPSLATSKVGSIGHAFPGGEMDLVDGDGNPLPPGEAEGELVYRGPNVTAGYAQTQADLQLGEVFNGEYRTGDIAKRDADGCYYVVGRKARFLKLFGHRVSLDACERLVADQFKVECVCVGTDKLMKIFVTQEGREGDVTRFLAETTGLPKTAFQASFVAEIPRFGSGKVNYKELDAKPL